MGVSYLTRAELEKALDLLKAAEEPGEAVSTPVLSDDPYEATAQLHAVGRGGKAPSPAIPFDPRRRRRRTRSAADRAAAALHEITCAVARIRDRATWAFRC